MKDNTISQTVISNILRVTALSWGSQDKGQDKLQGVMQALPDQPSSDLKAVARRHSAKLQKAWTWPTMHADSKVRAKPSSSEARCAPERAMRNRVVLLIQHPENSPSQA